MDDSTGSDFGFPFFPSKQKRFSFPSSSPFREEGGVWQGTARRQPKPCGLLRVDESPSRPENTLNFRPEKLPSLKIAPKEV
ncbi:MAG: hypothetical protein LBL72_04240 [Candidatus Accumulibacter sp.]|nr:hypothetical protein [Accumulibacter sp.]